MATSNYISLSNLTSFLNNLKNIFATKTETDAAIEKKAEKIHTHAISDVSNLQTTLNGKAASSHGSHVNFSTTAPVMDGTASVGSASTVARSDHKHPVDTSRAAQTDLDALETVVSGKANASHTHTIANVTNLQSTLDGKAASSHTHTVANISDLTATAAELNYMDGVTRNVQTQLDGKAASGHTHGLLHSDLTKTIDDTTTNSGWSMINDSYRGFILKSLRTNKTSPEWILDNYAAGIAFGGADTKGVLSHAYNSPNVRFAGGHGDTPVWNFTLKASSGQTYTLPSEGGTVALTSSNITGNAATATKLQTARYIGNASFNGTANISMGDIAGRANITSSGTSNANKYVKFARIDISSGPFTHCSGTLEFCPIEAYNIFGELAYYFRTSSTIDSVKIELTWKTLTNSQYADCINVVKVSNGVYDLYYRSLSNWETMMVTNIDCSNPSKVTLYSAQSYVESITVATTSKLNSCALTVTSDGVLVAI